MTRSKPPRKKPSTARRDGTLRKPLDAAMEASVQESVRAISKPIEDAQVRDAFGGKRAPRRPSKPSAASDPRALFARIVAGAKTEDQQLRAFEAAAAREIAFPVNAFVIGEPVEVVSVHYSGHPRAGITAQCRRDGNVYPVGLADVVFLPGSDGARFVSLYRAWLGLDELPQEPIRRSAVERVPVR